MQNKLYMIQFSHYLMTNLQPVPEQQSQNPEITDFAKFLKSLNSQTTWDSNSHKREELPAPPANPHL